MSNWTEDAPTEVGLYEWRQVEVSPQPCRGVVRVVEVEPNFGWIVGDKWLNVVGACKPELLGLIVGLDEHGRPVRKNLKTEWRKL